MASNTSKLVAETKDCASASTCTSVITKLQHRFIGSARLQTVWNASNASLLRRANLSMSDSRDLVTTTRSWIIRNRHLSLKLRVVVVANITKCNHPITQITKKSEFFWKNKKNEKKSEKKFQNSKKPLKENFEISVAYQIFFFLLSSSRNRFRRRHWRGSWWKSLPIRLLSKWARQLSVRQRLLLPSQHRQSEHDELALHLVSKL